MNVPESTSPFNVWNLKTGSILAFNSFVMYVIGSIITIFTYELSMALMAKFFDFRPILHYGFVELPTHNTAWLRVEVSFVYTVGSIVCFVLSIFAFSKASSIKRSNFNGRLFWSWLGIHSMAVFLQKWITAGILYDGLGVVAGWWFIDDPLVMLVSLLGVGILLITGFFLPLTFLHLIISKDIARAKWYKRLPYLLTITLLPWLAGSFLVFSIDNSFGYKSLEYVAQGHFYIYICAFWLLVIGLIFTYMFKSTRVVKLTEPIKPAWPGFIALIIMVLAARYSLFYGFAL